MQASGSMVEHVLVSLDHLPSLAVFPLHRLHLLNLSFSFSLTCLHFLHTHKDHHSLQYKYTVLCMYITFVHHPMYLLSHHQNQHCFPHTILCVVYSTFCSCCTCCSSWFFWSDKYCCECYNEQNRDKCSIYCIFILSISYM